jgi:DNA-binding PucR family transcriptional regulator
VQLLERDPQTLRDLTGHIRSRLDTARGGAQPLFHTLEAYFDTGANTTETARRLHLSPRAVTYRLATIERVTGLDPRRFPDRFTLQVAAIGVRLSME